MKTCIKTSLIIVSLCLCAFVAIFIGGCQNLRFAPTEPQKQLALQAHLTSRSIEASGADAHSPATKQQVQATQAALTYIGLPADPEIADYNTTALQATQDASRRPTTDDAFDAAEQGLSLAAELAILFGVGGAGFGGKKLKDWLMLARQKNKALAEIIRGNEGLKAYLRSVKKQNQPLTPDEVLAAFKQAQREQQVSPSTKRLVTELKP